MEATPEVTHCIPLGFVLTCISGLWEKKSYSFFSFGVKMYLNYRLVSCTAFQPWALCLRCCCLLLWEGLRSQASDHHFCVHYRTFPELESIRLPAPAAAVAAAAHFINIFGNRFSAARLLQTKPFSSDSFDGPPNFILHSCRRPTWPHLCAVCLAMYNGPQTLRARGRVSGLYVNTQLNHTGR